MQVLVSAIILFLFLSLFMFTYANPKDPELVEPKDDKPVKVIDKEVEDEKENDNQYPSYNNYIYGIGGGNENGNDDSFDDKNNNGIDDSKEEHFTVTFKAGEHGKLNGSSETIIITNVLTGTSVEAPEVTADEGYIFKEWTPEVSEKVTSDVTYTATYFEDKNNNGTDDEDEEHFTVTFKAGEHGTINNSTEDYVVENVLINTTVEAPEVSANENYMFIGWILENGTGALLNDLSSTLITQDVTFVAQYTDVPVKNITNGLIILDNNQKVTGVKIVPRNIFILEQSMQDAIIMNLKNVYNTIDYEFWVVVADRPVDINVYLSQLQLLYDRMADNKKRKLIMEDINKANMFKTNSVVDTEYFILFKDKNNDILQKRIRNLINNLASAGLTAFQTNNDDLRMILDNFLNGGQTTEFGTVFA